MMMEAEGPIDALIHLGDGYHDLADLGVPLPPVYQVAGNCDLFRSDTRMTVTLAGARLLLTHGHYQNVKQGRDQLPAGGPACLCAGPDALPAAAQVQVYAIPV
jgi:predicted phosphodiesterase